MSTKGLDYESLNENVKKTQYAVRGELYLRALELQMHGKEVSETHAFCSINNNNIYAFYKAISLIISSITLT